MATDTSATEHREAHVAGRDSESIRSSDKSLADASASLQWYTTHARRARLSYQVLEAFQIGTGAFIPLAAAVHWPIAVGASLGAAIAIAGGVRSVFRWQTNWIMWSVTAAKIQREILLYRSAAPPYDHATRGTVLVDKVAALGVAETLQWAHANDASQGAQAKPNLSTTTSGGGR